MTSHIEYRGSYSTPCHRMLAMHSKFDVI